MVSAAKSTRASLRTMHPYIGEPIEPGDLVRRNVEHPTPSMTVVKIEGSTVTCEWTSPRGTLKGDFPSSELITVRRIGWVPPSAG